MERFADLHRLEWSDREQLRGLFESPREAFAFLQPYRAAINIVRTLMENLDSELRYRQDHNPIHHVTSRIKSPESIRRKLARRELSATLENIRDLTDIAGVRVICYYIDDIYAVARMISESRQITLLRTADYIEAPKPNGYRSLHLVISVQPSLDPASPRVPVEIQIRTMAMDFWASLDHRIRYKVTADLPQEIHTRLRDCAHDIHQTDQQMQEISRAIQRHHQGAGEGEEKKE